MTRRWFTVLSAAMLLATYPSARGGPLAPGETRGGEAFVLDLDDPSFAGDTLLSQTTPFEILFEQPEGQTNFVRGTFTHLVVRESATGRLAFHYRVQETGSGGTITDFENMFVSGFSGFTTDVFSDQTDLTQARASRSADGDTIDFVADEEPSPAATAAPVPLPPAVWAGLATMVGFGVLRRIRSRRA